MPTPNVKMGSLKVILVAASVLALGAGVFAGMAVSRMPSSATLVPSQAVISAHLSIADELHLSDPQRDQMRSIWEGVRYNVHQTLDEAQAIQKQRDAAIFALLNDSQKAEYAALTQQAAEQFAKLNAQRQQAFADGVEQTKKILNDSQRSTYDRIIQDRLASGVGGSSAGNGTGGSSGASGLAVPTTEPVGR